jgi:hypothetical protein
VKKSETLSRLNLVASSQYRNAVASDQRFDNNHKIRLESDVVVWRGVKSELSALNRIPYRSVCRKDLNEPHTTVMGLRKDSNGQSVERI